MTRREIRETIFRLLFMEQFADTAEMEEKVNLYLEELKDGLMDDFRVKEVTFGDETYIREKVAAIAEKTPEIDEILNRTSKGWKTSRMGRAELSVLRLGVYEVLFDEEIPTGVAINEAVELAKKYGGDGAGSFVNGILGKVARDGAVPSGEADPAEKPAEESSEEAESSSSDKEPEKAAPAETGEKEE